MVCIFLIKLDVEALRALSRSAFSKLAARDYDFYTNNFVGSLSKKASAYARNFEMFTDTLTFNVVNELFPMIFAIIVLWRYSPIIPLALVFLFNVCGCGGYPDYSQAGKIGNCPARSRKQNDRQVVGYAYQYAYDKIFCH